MELNKSLTLGSLFDGSGGFPLGGLLCSITPVWASEIEPFPIRVTTKRLPQMKHYGDVSTMDGGKIEPVDIITFGSPCQDMSIAGRRAGLEGSRSNLFYQAVRIIKEMRCATNGRYPRYCVWENVPGAFSSNHGEDFKAVLDSLIGIVQEGAEVPMPENGRWPGADLYMGDGWSIAYRTLDAQYWGVPQRRKRIFLVADLAGQSAGRILFESEGVSGYPAQGFFPWEGTAARTEDGTGAASGEICLNDQGGNRMDVTEDVTCTLRAEAHHPPCVIGSAGFCTEHSAKARSIGYEEERSPTLRAGVVPAAMEVYENHAQDTRFTGPLDTAPTVLSTYGTGGNNQPFVVGTPKTLKIRSGCEGGGKGALIQEDKSATLGCNNDQTVFVPFFKGTRPHSAQEGQEWKEGEVANTLNTFDIGEQRCNELAVSMPKVYGVCSKQSHAMLSDNPNSGFYEADTTRTLDQSGGNPSCNQGGMLVVDEEAPAYCMTTGGFPLVETEISPSLLARDYKDPAVVGTPAYGIGRDAMNQGTNAQFAPSIGEEVQPTLVAKGPGGVVKADPEYIVRRLTPTECARLQGFPDWWCADLGTANPTYGDLDFWKEVFETYRTVVGGTTKAKTEKQIIKWLKDPHSDSAEYKMWGNGVALPCVCFVLAGIVWSTQSEG